MRYASVVLLLVLVGCPASQNTPEVNAIQRVTQGCATYDATLRSLALMRAGGKLSEEEIATVDRWRPIMNGICIGEVPDTAADSLLDTVEQALFELTKIEGGT